MLDIRLQEVAGYLEMEVVLISTDAECEKFRNVHCIDRNIDHYLILRITLLFHKHRVYFLFCLLHFFAIYFWFMSST